MDFESNEKVTQVLYIFIIGDEMISHYLFVYISVIKFDFDISSNLRRFNFEHNILYV
jgi:hypothetical protein